MDVDLEAVNEQVGTAIIDSMTSEIKKSSGDLADENGPVICGHILRIIKVIHCQGLGNINFFVILLITYILFPLFLFYRIAQLALKISH